MQNCYGTRGLFQHNGVVQVIFQVTRKKTCVQQRHLFVDSPRLSMLALRILLTGNDNSVVVFLGNNIEFGQERWDMVEASQRAEQIVSHLPKVSTLYREIYGFVDRSNQQLSYYNTEFCSVRKQSRNFESLCEMYALVNRHTLWRNSPNLTALTRSAKSQSAFRF